MNKGLNNLNDHWEKSWQKTSVKEELQTLKNDLILEYILEYLPKNGKIIEAGCGLGRYVIYLSRKRYDIIGVDLSAKTIKSCQKHCLKIKLNPQKFVVADITKLPFPNHFFSGCLSLGVVEHFIEGPQTALHETYRVLKKNGILILTTPNRYALFGPLVKIRHYFLFKGDFFQYEYSPQQLANFLKEVGFKIILKDSLDLEGGIPEFLKFLPIGSNLKRLIYSAVLPVAKVLEKTPLRIFGGVSIVVAQK